MIRRRTTVATLAVLALPLGGLRAARSQAGAPAPEPPPELAAELPAARLQGSGQLRFLGLRVYVARLWRGERAVADDWMLPLALELEYQRKLVGAQVAERSLIEMRRQGEIAADSGARWFAAMKALFPDVDAGHRLTGVHRPGEAARFFHNGRFLGEVRDAEFARLFFGIWLSRETSEPTLRAALLGR
jgi:hypothetical protein